MSCQAAITKQRADRGAMDTMMDTMPPSLALAFNIALCSVFSQRVWFQPCQYKPASRSQALACKIPTQSWTLWFISTRAIVTWSHTDLTACPDAAHAVGPAVLSVSTGCSARILLGRVVWTGQGSVG